MKARILAVTTTLAIAAFTNGVIAGTPTEQVQNYKKMLSKVPALEIPAKAAAEVKKAKPADKKATALAVYEAAFSISPAAGPTVARAITLVNPEVSLPSMQFQTPQQLAPAPGGPTVKPGFSSGENQNPVEYHKVIDVTPGEGRVYSR